MGIPAWIFFSLWAIISLTFLKLGFTSLSRTDLSTSVSPAVMSLLKHAFAISVCHSSNYALVYRPHLNINMVKHLMWIGNALNPLILWGSAVKNKWYYIYCASINLIAIVKERRLTALPEDHIGLNIDFVVKLSMYFIDRDQKLMPTLVLLTSIYTSAVWSVISDEEAVFRAAMQKEKPWIWREGESMVEHTVGLLCAVFMEKPNSSVVKRMVYRWRKLVRFGIGMVGTILFQSFFRLETFDHVVAFIYLAVAWLGNLAMLRPKGGDFGVFDFLLGNVVVGCTVSQFGVRGMTWIAFGAVFLLYGLRLKLEAVSLVNRRENYESRILV
ncbi:hypothetical protein PHJA_002073800 [Phtheirospermum japonicum]|uniref:Transmembrane protein n=1 Tax=Phtheirospermum japonicum TaxID=374723 RepID=A0A830CEW6_9LAMI|nr:hypothetical protein PHJA_002073800 [Phtheirospermum japonicum]